MQKFKRVYWLSILFYNCLPFTAWFFTQFYDYWLFDGQMNIIEFQYRTYYLSCLIGFLSLVGLLLLIAAFFVKMRLYLKLLPSSIFIFWVSLFLWINPILLFKGSLKILNSWRVILHGLPYHTHELTSPDRKNILNGYRFFQSSRNFTDRGGKKFILSVKNLTTQKEVIIYEALYNCKEPHMVEWLAQSTIQIDNRAINIAQKQPILIAPLADPDSKDCIEYP